MNDLPQEDPAPQPQAGGAQLDWTDPAAVQRWLNDLTTLVTSALDIADDQTRPLAQRELGRAAARRDLREVGESLVASIDHARRGLPQEGWIHVRVIDASPSGIVVNFDAGEAVKPHRLVVERGDLEGEMLRIHVIEDRGGDIVRVRLPRAGVGGQHVWIPRASVFSTAEAHH